MASEFTLNQGKHTFWILQTFWFEEWLAAPYDGVCLPIVFESLECLQKIGINGFLNLVEAEKAKEKIEGLRPDVKFRLVKITSDIKVEPVE
jgi:hypothetical protein